MKHIMLVIVTILCGAVSGWAQSPEVKELTQITNDWIVAGKNKDAAFLEKLLAPEYTFTGAKGILYDRNASIKRSLEPGNFTSDEVLDELQVRQCGALWFVTTRDRYKWTEKGVTTPYEVLSLDVYTRRDGRWQCVYSQNTAVVQMNTP